jgi:hypothetical protein
LQARGKASVKAPAKVVVQADVVAPVVPVEVQVGVGGDVEVGADAVVQTEVVAPPVEYTTPVALDGSAVVEFFGIPLEGVQDVVFVLDRSGSMENLALGQIASLAQPQPVAAPPAPVPPPDFQPPLPPEAMPPSPEGPPPDQAPPVLEDQAPDTMPASPEGQAPVAAPIARAPRKIDVAHAELVDALERLPIGTRMNVLFFNNRLEAVHATIAPLQESNREAIITFVLETFPDGRTALAPAMRTAFLLRAKRVILLSDGLGNLGGDAGSVLRDAREAMRGGVRIDTIGLGQDQDTWLLRTLADESGGIYQRL